eukprot:TRINITY_DN27403_c0_g1_i1.p1 TRINITY_DN27403_c0_g1~~TRINITY_DN27403_c0_g1_i1.p1  ORF type:complete len:895 (+),score=164.66 TRINITY_DN27403_c0_g1_i1:192-2876(+)
MEECCAICAEPLIWLAYGQCGHRDICSTCMTRMRFILGDKCCCICKRDCPVVFMTKALGDYTNVITDFSSLPSATRDGKVGEYWFHSDTTAYFDDEDHYKMIKAMCRLSCSVCSKVSLHQDAGKEIHKWGRDFKDMDHLRKHLESSHKLFMCTLCLEGRKVFICEQKLYTRAQLGRHLSHGDTMVDENEIKSGAFLGHPMCKFCQKPFYSDNELYSHMTREHFTCHICQRNNPGNFEYYQNYDDLETHFGQVHYLCEHADCLEKKFVVFASEAELKRHNAQAHPSNMSRSQRNAALQIPINFQYRSHSEDQRSRRGGRGRGPRSNEHMSRGNQASNELSNLETAVHESMLAGSLQTDDNFMASNDQELPLASSDVASSSIANVVSDTPPRYISALNQGVVNSKLSDSAFPPLPGVSDSTSNRRNNKQKKGKSLASVIRGGQPNTQILFSAAPRNNIVLGQTSSSNTAGFKAFRNRDLDQAASSSNSSPNEAFPSLPSSSHANVELAWANRNGNSKPVKSDRTRKKILSEQASSSSNSMNSKVPEKTRNRNLNNIATSSTFDTSDEFPSLSSLNPGTASTNRQGDFKMSGCLVSGTIANSSSNTLEALPGLSPVSIAREKTLKPEDFPVLRGRQASAATSESSVPHNQVMNDTQMSDEEMRAANRTLIENIKLSLGGDDTKFTAFRSLSLQFCKGDVKPERYYRHILSMGLSHLVTELARLCPDKIKQKELLDVHGFEQKNSQQTINAISYGMNHMSIAGGKADLRKAKQIDARNNEANTSKISTDAECSTGKSLDEMEGLSKDGYRTTKGKSKLHGLPSGSNIFERVNTHPRRPPLSDNVNQYFGEKWSCGGCTFLNESENNHCVVCGNGRPSGVSLKGTKSGGKDKRKKKTVL